MPVRSARLARASRLSQLPFESRQNRLAGVALQYDLQAAGGSGTTGSSALVVAWDLNASGGSGSTGSSALIATFTLTATGGSGTTGSSALTQLITLTATGGSGSTGTSALVQTWTLAAAGGSGRTGSSALLGTFLLAAAGVRAAQGAAALSISGQAVTIGGWPTMRLETRPVPRAPEPVVAGITISLTWRAMPRQARNYRTRKAVRVDFGIGWHVHGLHTGLVAIRWTARGTAAVVLPTRWRDHDSERLVRMAALDNDEALMLLVKRDAAEHRAAEMDELLLLNRPRR